NNAKPAASSAPAASSSKNAGSKGKKGADAQQQQQAVTSDFLAPPKPTARQILAGCSSTRKLPVNLFNEMCQKQKWNQPVYDMRKTPEGFLCSVTLSSLDPKTRELIKLEPFRIPREHQHLLCKPTPLEARHFAATYALF